MSPYRILGLGEDVTEPEIKRAYARLLKQHRPEADPAGFQRLHEAYTHCLAHARYRAEYGDDTYDDGDDGAEVTTSFDTPALTEAGAIAALAVDHQLRAIQTETNRSGVVRERITLDEPADDETWEVPEREAAFDCDGFVAELMQRIRDSGPRDLSDWLNRREALYSLQLKQMLSAPVAHELANASPLPDEERLKVVLEFFGLDGLGQQHGWIEHSVQSLWQRLEDQRGFDRVLAEYQSPRTKPVDRMLLHELITPRNWLRFQTVLLCPFLPSRTRSLLLNLEAEGGDAAQARINHYSANFWRRAADPDRLDWRRALVVLLRLSLLVALHVTLLAKHAIPMDSAVKLGAGGLLLWMAYAVISVAWRRLLRWNREHLQWDMPLVLAGVVMLAALSLGFFAPGWAVPLSILTLMLWLAQRKDEKYYAAIGAAVFGFFVVLLEFALLSPPGEKFGTWPYLLAAIYGTASVIAHDVVYARRKQVLLMEARAQMGWLGWLLVAHGATFMASLIVAGALSSVR